jgi:hypothetical protein
MRIQLLCHSTVTSLADSHRASVSHHT